MSAARWAALLVGLIHGMWHWPLFFLSTRLDAGSAFPFPLVYLVFTCSMSVLLSWGTLRSGSVWPAAIGHGAINGTAALAGYLLKGSALPLLGPTPTGLIGGLGISSWPWDCCSAAKPWRGRPCDRMGRGSMTGSARQKFV